MTLTATIAPKHRDPKEAIRLHKRFAEELSKFEQCLLLGFSEDDMCRFHSKGLLFEIALYYKRKAEMTEITEGDNYTDFEEITNEALA